MKVTLQWGWRQDTLMFPEGTSTAEFHKSEIFWSDCTNEVSIDSLEGYATPDQPP